MLTVLVLSAAREQTDKCIMLAFSSLMEYIVHPTRLVWARQDCPVPRSLSAELTTFFWGSAHVLLPSVHGQKQLQTVLSKSKLC